MVKHFSEGELFLLTKFMYFNIWQACSKFLTVFSQLRWIPTGNNVDATSSETLWLGPITYAPAIRSKPIPADTGESRIMASRTRKKLQRQLLPLFDVEPDGPVTLNPWLGRRSRLALFAVEPDGRWPWTHGCGRQSRLAPPAVSLASV